MSRVGQNPMKWLHEQPKAQKITITTIVHVPVLEGFWAESFSVLQLFFRSLRRNTGHPFDLYVFDNGSCTEIQDYLLELRRQGIIQCLILSQHNLRKLGALNFLLQVAPGEIVSFADSDVLFLPGWLDETLAVLDAFPEAGQVTALPTADTADRHCSGTREAVRKSEDITLREGPDLIPEAHIEAHRVSLGSSREEYASRLLNRQDIQITRHGVSAFVSAQDFQFTTRRKVLEQVLPLQVTEPGEYYDPVYSPVLEKRVDALGFWRLSTTGYRIHHLGNAAPSFQALPKGIDADPALFEETGVAAGGETPEQQAHSKPRVHNRYFRRWLKRINTLTYRLLYEP